MSETVKSKRNARRWNGLGSLLRSEFPLIIGAVTAAIFLWTGSRLVENLEHPGVMGVVFLWLFLAVLWSAISVVRHADRLAIKCGEPYGTLILTLSAITIEVMMISAAMLHGKNNPTLARDMMFAVVMIALNGLIGLSLLLGGLRHHENENQIEEELDRGNDREFFVRGGAHGQSIESYLSAKPNRLRFSHYP